MNWKEIEEKYPKAWELFGKRYGIYLDLFWKITDDGKLLDTDYESGGYFELRHLYDFFDEQDIYVSVIHNEVTRKFYYDISTKPMRSDINSLVKYSRTEAESVAFTKAFELLENR